VEGDVGVRYEGGEWSVTYGRRVGGRLRLV
jgi:hypothetical protein